MIAATVQLYPPRRVIRDMHHEPTEFRSSDLYLVAFLVTVGYEVLRIDPSDPSTRRKYFVLSVPPEQAQLFAECKRAWWNRSAACNAVAYAHALQGLKAAVHQ